MLHTLDPIFRPHSVAIIGASTRKGTIGRETLHNLLIAEFNGKVFPVNPKATVIHSIKAYSTILDVPDAVDLAVIIVPKEQVVDVATRCGMKGVKGLVVISAGFSETGPAGKKLEDDLVQVVRKYNMRMIGPNCFGVVNTDPEINLNATFGKVYPKHGRVGFITQSGAMGEAIMMHAKELGIGFSKVASIGNKADVSANDCLEYFHEDNDTDIVLMYIENFGNPRRFTAIAREMIRRKPIVVVKSGRTKLGAKAASSHTGSLAGLDVGVDALFEQTGVMRVDTVEELFDVAKALSTQPVPKGNRVVVVSNAGGPGILATDALISNGLEMPPISPATQTHLKNQISKDASFSNPMDMVAGAGPREFKMALETVKEDPNYDTIMPIFVPPVTVNQLEVAQNIVDALAGTSKTVLACFMGAGRGSEGIEYLKSRNIPVYIYPESVARTLSTICRYRERASAPRGKKHSYRMDGAVIEQIVKNALDAGHAAIVGDDAMQILQACGIRAAHYHYASSASDAVSAAESVGYPVVMKINTPTILHKTESGGVILDLRTDKEVHTAFTELGKRAGKEKPPKGFSVAIQQMVSGGIETVIGMTSDPSFGPILMFGLGGIHVEVMKDVAFRVTPLTDTDARDMISSLNSYKLLSGYRGAPAVDIAAIQETLLRVSQLVGEFDAFSEIDINPFIASSSAEKCVAVDARFILRHR